MQLLASALPALDLRAPAFFAIVVASLALPTIASAAATDADSAVVAESDSVRGIPAPGREARTDRSTFRGWPYPESRVFILLSAGYMAPVQAVDHPEVDPGGRLTVDFGVMGNVGERWGVGISAHLEEGDEDESFGAVVRVRRWLNRRTALDAGFGRLLPTEVTDPFRLSTETQSAFLLELQHANLISVFVQVETWKVVPGDTGWSGPTESGTIWYVGGRGHYLPGLAALIGILVLAASSLG